MIALPAEIVKQFLKFPCALFFSALIPVSRLPGIAASFQAGCHVPESSSCFNALHADSPSAIVMPTQ